MKNRVSKTGTPPAAPPGSNLFLPFGLVGLGALIIAGVVYRPALHGAFVFDDLALPFELTNGEAPLAAWLSGVRPVLMLSYWINHALSSDPFGYHLVNVMIHAFNTSMVFLILRRLLTLVRWPPRRVHLYSLIGAAIFLVHPLATESVSYIAGRSESLAAALALAAYVWFLERREVEVRWGDATGIVVLFALAVAAKENMAALAAVLLLTDWVFPRAGTRRVYLLLAPGAAFAATLIVRALLHGGNAGFSVREFTWYQYGFTQLRALFVYARMAVLPVGLSVDHDFPISYSIFQHASWLCGGALVVLTLLAFRKRRSYPLAFFGLLMFLILLAPTSSVVPIADALVERRMYLPLMGLILIGCEVAARLRVSPPFAWSLIASLLLALCILTWDRNVLWGHPEQLLASAALQSAHNPRPVANLTEALIADNRCSQALPWLERAERLLPYNQVIEASWGRTLECLGRREEALARIRTAVQIHPTSKLLELMGLLYGEMGQMDAAGAALREAVKMDPGAGSAHRSLALWYEATLRLTGAAAEYRAALAVDSYDRKAELGLARVQALAKEQAQRAPERPQPTATVP